MHFFSKLAVLFGGLTGYFSSTTVSLHTANYTPQSVHK